MPEPKKKKGLLTIPPELQEYIKSPKFGREFGQGYPFSPETEMWGQLSPRNMYDYLSETDPYYLYRIQLRDYLSEAIKGVNYREAELGEFVGRVKNTPRFKLRDENGDPFEDRKDPETGRMISAEEQALARALDIIKEAEIKINSGFYPIETLPFYEESKETLGMNFKREYESLLINEMQTMEQEQLSRQKALRNVYSPQGRQALQDFVNTGEIPSEQAYGQGSEWEKWQREQAGWTPTTNTELALKNITQGLNREGAGRQATAQREQQMSKNSQLMKFLYPELYSQYEQEMLRGWGLGGGGAPSSQGGLRYTNPNLATLAATFQKDVEDQPYDPSVAFATMGGKGGQASGSYIPQGWLEAGFSSWLDLNPNAKKSMTEKQYKMMTDNPTTYPAYMQYVGGYQPTSEQAMPFNFEEWQSQDLTGKMLSEAERKRKWEAEIAAKGRLAPVTKARL